MEQKNNFTEWDWGKELDELDSDVETYWNNFDKEETFIDWEKLQEDNKNSFLELLKGEMGKDIDNVTSGKVKVKLSFKYKVKHWIKRIFEIFS